MRGAREVITSGHAYNIRDLKLPGGAVGQDRHRRVRRRRPRTKTSCRSTRGSSHPAVKRRLDRRGPRRGRRSRTRPRCRATCRLEVVKYFLQQYYDLTRRSGGSTPAPSSLVVRTRTDHGCRDLDLGRTPCQRVAPLRRPAPPHCAAADRLCALVMGYSAGLRRSGRRGRMSQTGEDPTWTACGLALFFVAASLEATRLADEPSRCRSTSWCWACLASPRASGRTCSARRCRSPSPGSTSSSARSARC